MSVQLAPLPVQRFFDNNNNPLAGGQLFTYQAGTTTPQATYTDSTGGTPNQNPIPLNARGEASVWLTYGQAYKFVLQDANGNMIWTQDQIGGGLGAGLNLVVNSIASLRTLSKFGVPTALATGYYKSGDGGGGVYFLNTNDTTSADNGGTIIVASDGGRWYLQLTGPVSIKQFGAYGDGTHSDDTAMTNWLAVLTPTLGGYAPAGTYNFTAAKTLPLLNDISINGDSARQTAFQYTGGSTTIDLWTVGDGTNSYTGWSLTGFRFDSTTVMTGGAALHLKRMQKGNQLFDIDAGVFTQTTKHLWNGIWLDNVNVFKYTRFNIQVQNEGLMMNGSASSDEGSDIFLDDGVITDCGSIAYHVGGGQGGVYFGKVLAFGNGTNFQVDNALVTRKNREIFFSDLCIGDGCVNYNLYIDDTLTADSPIAINGPMASAGLSGSGGVGINIYVKSWPEGRITVGPGQLYNATSDGMRVDDSTCVISISPARHIFNNGGYGINATVATTNIYNDARYQSLNVLGNQSANVQNPSWQSFATSVTTKTGSITTLGLVDLFYQLAGGVCHFTANISITTNGTGAGSVDFTLPRTAAGFGTVYGKELVSGKALSGIVTASNIEDLQFYDGTYPGSDGCTLVVSGSYQYV